MEGKYCAVGGNFISLSYCLLLAYETTGELKVNQ